MNPGIGAPELLVIAIIALVVVGPKDLPLMVRRVGRFVGKMRGLAREFQRSFDELGREAELAEMKREIEQLKRNNPMGEIRREFEAAESETRAAAEDRPHPRVKKDAPLKGEPLKFGPAAEAGDAASAPPQAKAEPAADTPDLDQLSGSIEDPEPTKKTG
ncbi:MAG: Sec-independent protein translocase protein TatB [Oceanicaulis sp.]